jgi:hypothetical protein
MAVTIAIRLWHHILIIKTADPVQPVLEALLGEGEVL